LEFRRVLFRSNRLRLILDGEVLRVQGTIEFSGLIGAQRSEEFIPVGLLLSITCHQFKCFVAGAVGDQTADQNLSNLPASDTTIESASLFPHQLIIVGFVTIEPDGATYCRFHAAGT